MELLPADYALGGLTLAMAVIGLFCGFSGTLAFAVACVLASLMAAFVWPYSETLTPVLWLRCAVALVATLVTFGLSRIVVKKCVNGLLSQPSDAIFGFLVGAVMGLLIISVWAYVGAYTEYSNIVRFVSPYIPRS